MPRGRKAATAVATEETPRIQESRINACLVVGGMMIRKDVLNLLQDKGAQVYNLRDWFYNGVGGSLRRNMKYPFVVHDQFVRNMVRVLNGQIPEDHSFHPGKVAVNKYACGLENDEDFIKWIDRLVMDYIPDFFSRRVPPGVGRGKWVLVGVWTDEEAQQLCEQYSGTMFQFEGTTPAEQAAEVIWDDFLA